MDDIVLDYPVFDACTGTLTSLVEFLKNTKDGLTSSATYAITLAINNALDNLPCEAVAKELLTILSKHGWDESIRQFPSILHTTLSLAEDIDVLADRLLAN